MKTQEELALKIATFMQALETSFVGCVIIYGVGSVTGQLIS